MRRLGYETPTAFEIALENKLNEIMPNYNKLFDALDGWNILEDGEVETRVNEETNTSTTSTTSTNSGTEDLRYSNTPQNRLTDVQNGSYVTDYNYNTSSSSGTAEGEADGTRNIEETITRTPSNKMEIYKNFIVKSRKNLYIYSKKEMLICVSFLVVKVLT